MTTLDEPRVIAAERLGSGALVEFADGKSALFPASFLSAHRPWYAIDLPPGPDELVDAQSIPSASS